MDFPEFFYLSKNSKDISRIFRLKSILFVSSDMAC